MAAGNPAVEMRKLALVGIILAGLIVRLVGYGWGQGYTYYTIRSEIKAYEVALDYLHGNPTAQYIGQPLFNDGHVPGPLWAMLWSLPLRFGCGTRGVVLLIILLNTAVIPLVYLLSRNLFGPRSALWAALAWAFLPVSILSSVGAVNPFPLPFLCVLLYWALWKVTQQDRSRGIFAVMLLLGMMPQFHMIAFFTIPAVLLLLWLSPRPINKGWLLLGVLAASALYIPYLWGEMHHGWSNTHKIFAHRTWEFSFGVLKVFTVPAAEMSSILSRSLGTTWQQYRRFGDAMFGSFWLLFVLNGISLVLAALLLGDFTIAAFRHFQKNWRSPRQAFTDSPATVFCCVFLFVPSLFFVFTQHGYNGRYALPQLPILVVLFARFAAHRLDSPRWANAWLAGLVVVLASGVWISLAYFRYEGRMIANADYYIPSFEKMENTYRALHASAGPGAFLHVDVEAVPHNHTATEMTRGIQCLAQYINMRERIDHEADPSPRELDYLLTPANPKTDSTRRVVYASNGIVICKIDARMPSSGRSENPVTDSENAE